MPRCIPPSGTLPEPFQNPSGTLTPESLQTTPEPIWAKTPKLLAVGEETKLWFINLGATTGEPFLVGSLRFWGNLEGCWAG